MNIARIKTLTIAAVTGLMLAGCASLGGGGPAGVTVLTSGNHSNIKDQTYKDIHTQADFDKFWDQAFGGMGMAPDKPTVDFSKDMVIASFIGEQTHGGFVIRITKVENTGSEIDVTVTVTIPGANCRYPRNSTEQFQFATLPASTEPVNFNLAQQNAPACG